MVRRTYTETIDLNTRSEDPVFWASTPIGQVYDFLQPFFQAYKKYKYGRMLHVNSARLPYDPEQLGKVEGENYVTPGILLTPSSFKGCHGEALGSLDV